MKKILIALLIVSLSGCGAADRFNAVATGYAEMCIDGVTYIQFASGGTVKVDITGKPVPCKK